MKQNGHFTDRSLFQIILIDGSIFFYGSTNQVGDLGRSGPIKNTNSINDQKILFIK